jgi:steroid delta-isomerase-like uncharacterized protein
MSDENKAVVRRIFEDVLSGGDFDAIAELFGPNLVVHHPDVPYETRGQDGIRERLRGPRTAFPDLDCQIHDLFAEGDRVAIRYTVRGTNTGEIMGAEPTGKQFELEAQAIYRLEGGRVVEIWEAWNVLGLMQQLGMAE